MRIWQIWKTAFPRLSTQWHLVFLFAYRCGGSAGIEGRMILLLAPASRFNLLLHITGRSPWKGRRVYVLKRRKNKELP